MDKDKFRIIASVVAAFLIFLIIGVSVWEAAQVHDIVRECMSHDAYVYNCLEVLK